MSDSATLWTVAHQAPLSMGFSRQEYWTRLPYSSLGDLPNPGLDPASLMSPALAGKFFTTSTTWEAPTNVHDQIKKKSQSEKATNYMIPTICHSGKDKTMEAVRAVVAMG